MTAHADRTAAAAIRLESLVKRYPGQADPAVDNLTMDIPAGEIVVLVGPSGCGKTTALKMINRIIEPTAGRILLDGEDVTDVDANRLRRRIGYVIQHVGLFPHMTVGENIGLVPKLLGWSRSRIADRVDELLDLVGMDPAVYSGRYPKELSGGQSQRVGVARAMGADPPVLLMDEPFGAIDPITRGRLQTEFLRLQSDIRKTIVFVTHDIDEAIKLGDRIAILTRGARIAQYDTPEVILAAPADAFVADFIGTGASLKGLTLSRVRDVVLDQWPVGHLDGDRVQLRRMLADSDHGSLLLLDQDQRPVRWVTNHDLDQNIVLDQAGFPAAAVVEPHATLHDALNEMVSSHVGCAIVVDGQRRYMGVVDMQTVMRAVDGMREDLAAHDRGVAAGLGAA